MAGDSGVALRPRGEETAAWGEVEGGVGRWRRASYRVAAGEEVAASARLSGVGVGEGSDCQVRFHVVGCPFFLWAQYSFDYFFLNCKGLNKIHDGSANSKGLSSHPSIKITSK
jgi:hypothetical protein